MPMGPPCGFEALWDRPALCSVSLFFFDLLRTQTPAGAVRRGVASVGTRHALCGSGGHRSQPFCTAKSIYQELSGGAMLSSSLSTEWVEAPGSSQGNQEAASGSPLCRAPSTSSSLCFTTTQGTSRSNAGWGMAGTMLSRSSSGGSSVGAVTGPATPLQRGVHQKGLEAPVPCRAADSVGAENLLRHFSSFDGLEVHPLTQHLAAVASASPVPTGPPPHMVLAALSASLASRQQREPQQQQPLWRMQQPSMPLAPVGAAASARSPFACRSCCCALADEAAYQEHCASLEHTMGLVRDSLALSSPRVAARVAGICMSPAHGHSWLLSGWPALASRYHTLCSQPPERGNKLPSPLLNGASHRLLHLASGVGARLGQAPGGMWVPAAAAAGPTAGPASNHQEAEVPLPPGPASPAFTTCLNQMIDPQLDALCHSLLKHLRQQDCEERRVACRVAAGLRMPRRLVGGLREVRKAVQLSAAVALVVAVDIQETSSRTHSTTTPGAEVAEICGRAAAHSIPVVFALSRVGLGSVFGANKRMSAVALTSVVGLEAHLQHVLHLAALGRARFALFQTQWGARIGAM